MLRDLLRRASPLRSLYYRWLGITYLVRSLRSPFLRFSPAGHFHSPLPDMEEIERRKAELFPENVNAIAGIDLRAEEQISLLQELAGYCVDFPFQPVQTPGMRYYWKNIYFGIHDALILFGLMRAKQPKRVIEIGSGFSSAFMIDTAERFLEPPPHFTFIEPYPQRLNSLLSQTDIQRYTLVEQPVQSVPLSLFETLEAGDILFVDSTHVAKVGSDVLHVFFEILPRLKPGVLVHFHDISWPFQYPLVHIRMGIAWNEIYLLRAFLQYNAAFQIRYFSAYMQAAHTSKVKECLPLALQDPGCSSLWISRLP